METQTHPCVFIISGPIGVGKTATTKVLVGLIPNSVCISGDFLLEQLDAVESKISWERRLKITWQNIFDICNRYIENNLSVFIDFVVEDELEIIKQKLDQKITVYYLVLMASPQKLKERIIGRDGSDIYFRRSMELYNVISQNESNAKHRLQTTDRSVKENCQIFLDKIKDFAIKK